jgi:hypothetical protein
VKLLWKDASGRMIQRSSSPYTHGSQDTRRHLEYSLRSAAGTLQRSHAPMRFLDIFSAMSLSACGGIHVCTKEARLRIGEPSSSCNGYHDIPRTVLIRTRLD